MALYPRKFSHMTVEPVDDWLRNNGLYRKRAPKDPTCLFRAISEQIMYSQKYHLNVRKECVKFIKINRKMFEKRILIPFELYLDQMICFTEWGGINEIFAMSMLYQRNVVIFHGQRLVKETIIDNGCSDNFYLCFTPPKQYETVCTEDYISQVGFCQSLMYQVLYKRVFQMKDIDMIISKMLHEKNNNFRHEKFFQKRNVNFRNKLTLEILNKINYHEQKSKLSLLCKGITPFPYRVAKALDPNIYRNIEFDIWHEIKKEVKNLGFTHFNNSELQVGSKCFVAIDLIKINVRSNKHQKSVEKNDNSLVKINSQSQKSFYVGHIQNLSKNKGPVDVFIEELGKKLAVPYEALKLFPHRKLKHDNLSIFPLNDSSQQINQNLNSKIQNYELQVKQQVYLQKHYELINNSSKKQALVSYTSIINPQKICLVSSKKTKLKSYQVQHCLQLHPQQLQYQYRVLNHPQIFSFLPVPASNIYPDISFTQSLVPFECCPFELFPGHHFSSTTLANFSHIPKTIFPEILMNNGRYISLSPNKNQVYYESDQYSSAYPYFFVPLDYSDYCEYIGCKSSYF